ncbi:hypothetical protein HO133_007616 [Letharia lupina]|uniref:Uncharacterized protein n=1 Tax=Letharia lupina TaxID=560253 RepID=A0A8H6CQU7_9LECA|nr:uncharacterized protein HO133_007616 [Letharia lupina]KAF6227888.1 hypothetical protein HO133_007616 [Letharia lupina]
MNSTSWDYGNPAIGTPYLNAYLAITAYSITTTSSTSGNCVKHANSPIPLITAYTANITSPFDFLSFLPTSSLAGLTATEGLEGCTASIPPSQSIPTFVGARAAVSATVASPATPAEGSAAVHSAENLTGSSTPGSRGHPTQIIILSVVLPTVGIMILLFCFIIVRRYRNKRSQAADAIHPEKSSDAQLYVDQKAELEDEERRRHELEAERTRHELNGEDTIFEMPDNGHSRMHSASSHRPHELRGAEHSQELEVPSNV